MTDLELAALTQVVRRETTISDGELKKYGELQFDPVTPAYTALHKELEHRNIINPVPLVKRTLRKGTPA